MCKRNKRVVSVGPKKEVDIKEDLKVGMETYVDEDMLEEATYDPHASIAVRLVMSHGYALSCACFVHIVIFQNM
jgi:hypothetical protein